VATESGVRKPAIPLELFFDLVFVFAITQIVSVVVHDLTWSGFFHGALILALLWWGWGQFTWTANSIDLTPRVVRAGFLAAMVVIFVMAHAVPTAFDGGGSWLAFGYLAIKVIALILFWTGTSRDEVQRTALRTYAPAAMVGPVLIIIGSYMGAAQQWWWLAGGGFELVSAALAGRVDWHIQVDHFAERHGLIMIIAFGEAIVAIGAVIADEDPSWEIAGLMAIGILGAIALWWAYFDRMEELWEWAMERADTHEKGVIARDVYSLLHYPMIAGVVLYAVAVEEVFLHPGDPMEGMVKAALGLALLLFLLPIVVATWRTMRAVQYERGVAALAIAGFVFVSGELAAKNVLLVTTVLLLAAMTIEYFRYRESIRQGLATEGH